MQLLWRFIQDFEKVAKPINIVTKKNKMITRTHECQQALESLKRWLTTASILTYPEDKYPFILDTSASENSKEVVLP